MFGLDPVDLMIRVPVVLLALTVHEFSHAYFALRMGDPTAYRMGRVSLNPLRHLEPLGTICLLFAPIGWAKPVPINSMNFHDRRKGIILSTAAGPLSNVAQAVVFALLLRGLLHSNGVLADARADDFLRAAYMMCSVGIVINVGLAVFNCIPLYPLDGFHIVGQLMPPASQQRFMETARFGPMAILGLILAEHFTEVDLLTRLIWRPAQFIFENVAGVGG